MLPDPYSPGALPGYLAGRDTELTAARRALGPVALGRAAGPLLAFDGARGVGKTSLLRTIQREAAGSRYLTAWVTARSDQPLVVAIADALAVELRDTKLRERASLLAHRIDKIRVELGVPGAKISADLNPRPDVPPPPPGLEELLEDTARFARNHDRQGLVVFVDEFQDAPLRDRKSLLIALQHYDGAMDGCPIAVIAAGLPSLPAAVTEAATFGERSRFITIGALQPVAVAEALRVPAADHGINWADDAIDAALQESRGYAYKIQLLGSAAWTAAAPRGEGDAIMLPHVRQAIGMVDRQMQTMFAARLAKTNREERRLLRALAAVIDDDGIAARADAAAHLNADSRSLSRPRQSLLDKGIIEAAGRGELRFTIPGFEHFLHTVED